MHDKIYKAVGSSEIDRVLFSYTDHFVRQYTPSFHKDYMNIENILAPAQDYVIDLDKRAVDVISGSAGPKRFYKGKSTEEKKYESLVEQRYSYTPMHHSHYVFTPDIFLTKERVPTKFVENFQEIKEYAEDAFKKLMDEGFPKDVLVNVCTWEELKREYPQFMDKCRTEVLGFAINRKHLALASIIFVKKDSLDRLLLTLGHEIGHVLSKQLSSSVDEEAKAFAFSIAWAETIRKSNIAGLKNSIRTIINPAENGIHDKALDFVLKQIKLGKKPFELFKEFSNSNISVEEQFSDFL